MESLKLPCLQIWKNSFGILLAMLTLFISAPISRADGPEGRVTLQSELAADKLSLKVKVPQGTKLVTLMKFSREKGWERFASRKASPGLMSFKLPAATAGIRWRAVGRYRIDSPSLKKFPAAFFKGKRSFGSAKSNGTLVSRGGDVDSLVSGGLASDSNSTPGVTPEEADIWKIDGSTVYFFNQLRGLQVLDLANPADPRLTASLRLPAFGEDLYLLPAAGGSRKVVLLTQEWNLESGSSTRIVVVKVTGTNATVVESQMVSGSLSDSRLVGDRLILATSEYGNSSSGYAGKIHLTEWLVKGTPELLKETTIDGSSPIISSGPDWLAVASNPSGRWDVSEVSIFAIRPDGLIRMAPPIQTEGTVSNKFAIQWSSNTLTTISEKSSSSDQWRPTTVLENFRAWGPEVIHPMVIEDRLGRLELAQGESLYATRFAGDKVYIVTFLQTDPLWVVDLSDVSNPKVAGQLEVPGWSSHLEPLGDLLLSIGWESGTVVASLFDVKDPAAPAILQRLKLGDAGSYSEALWDEKALKVLPSAGLAMIPLSSYYDRTGASSFIQLLDIDLENRDLKLRGTIPHSFNARRADVIGDSAVSISQRVLVSTGIEDRDAPKMLAEVTLAWPVDRVVEANGSLIEIEDGSFYGGGTATARIAPANEPEAILAEFPLGEGIVKTAEFRDGKLFVLRQITQDFQMYYLTSIRKQTTGIELALDVYDATTPTSLVLLGSCPFSLGAGAKVATDSFLWPQPDRPSLVVNFRYFYWYDSGPIVLARSESLAQTTLSLPRIGFYPWVTPQSAKPTRLCIFNVADSTAPKFQDRVSLVSNGGSFNGVSSAADGLVVVGITSWKSISKYASSAVTNLQGVRVVDVPASGDVSVRPFIDLPGNPFAITELDADGFLVFSRNSENWEKAEYQVSASDGHDAFQVASVDGPAYAPSTAGGRRLFIGTDQGVSRYRLTDDGKFSTESDLETGWRPYYLRWVNGVLTGTGNLSIFAAGENDDSVLKWKFSTWYVNLNGVRIAADGDLLVPLGAYGAERLDR